MVLQYNFCGCMPLNQLLPVRHLDCVQLFAIMNCNVVNILVNYLMHHCLLKINYNEKTLK